MRGTTERTVGTGDGRGMLGVAMCFSMRFAMRMAICVALLAAAPLRAEDRGDAPGPEEAAEAAALAVLDDFMAAFNARDMEAWEATYHFPHFRVAGGGLTVLPRGGERSSSMFEMLGATGWHHSAWIDREVIQADHEKVHIAVSFARYREDGSELARYESLYVVTHDGEHWGIKGRSSFAP